MASGKRIPQAGTPSQLGATVDAPKSTNARPRNIDYVMPSLALHAARDDVLLSARRAQRRCAAQAGEDGTNAWVAGQTPPSQLVPCAHRAAVVLESDRSSTVAMSLLSCSCMDRRKDRCRECSIMPHISLSSQKYDDKNYTMYCSSKTNYQHVDPVGTRLASLTAHS